ncbi:MAG: NAD(P)/FAD-dependent oxidoreductase [Phycisphaeraceae bacterium]|nr:NAD(P)/FAD-dependent oxidoreductase [Phycisphaeraceae bacterium]
MSDHYEVLICGGGTAGLTVASQLCLEEKAPSVGIIEPSDKHYYQPLWTLVGGGVFPREESERNEADYIPVGADWIRDRVAGFDPDNNTVTLESGRQVTYGHLVVALGIQINWNAIPGLMDVLGKPGTGVCSNYSYDTVRSTWDAIRGFKGGKAIFTEPITGVKCGGAPQKIMYLAEDYFRRHGIRDRCEVMFCNAKASHFSCDHYTPTLLKLCDERGIRINSKTELMEVRGAAKEARFKHTETGAETVMRYDMLHVTPPMGPPDLIRNSPLANEAGWVDVDKNSLRHTRYGNVFALGDCSSLPTSKTGAAIRKQAPTAVQNILADRSGRPATASYDGYTSCPVVTGYGRLVLAEFDYTKGPCESFPFDQNKERYSMYALKAYGLPRMYWHGMLRGRV